MKWRVYLPRLKADRLTWLHDDSEGSVASAWADSEGTPWMLSGPAVLHMSVAPHVAILGPPFRWQTFLTDVEAAVAVGAVAHAIAAIVDSSHVIYLPDSYYCASQAESLAFDGHSIEELLDWLGTHCGPAQYGHRDIVSDGTARFRSALTADSYFVDTVCGPQLSEG